MANYLTKRRKWLLDLAERAGWAAVWAVVSVVSVEQLGLPPAYVPFAVILLSAIKSAVAKNIGRDDSASVVPQV